jgi:uncharacterized protein
MIWHLLPLSRWRSVTHDAHDPHNLHDSHGPGDPYVPGTRDAAGFVHASPDERAALAVANALYRQADEPMVALQIDTARLSAQVRYEPADPVPPPGVPEGTLFPHIYGPVETSAVVGMRYLRRDAAGRYTGLETRPATAEALDLLPHPEGGWYRQTWSAEPGFHPPGYTGRRAAATAIYFLLPPGTWSSWHAVRSAEMWLWHAGGPLTLLTGGTGARPAGGHTAATLGPDLTVGQRPQHLVPAGHWQSARPAEAREVLVTCVVAPGFDFADFTVPPSGRRDTADP